MTFLPDVDAKSVGAEKRHFPNWATKHILCPTNTATKWGSKHKDVL